MLNTTTSEPRYSREYQNCKVLWGVLVLTVSLFMLFDLFKKIILKTLCLINMMHNIPTHLNTNLTKLLFFENWVAESEVVFLFVCLFPSH